MVTPSVNRWTESIAQKVKRKKQVPEHTKKKIWRSVFEPTIPQAPNYGFVRILESNWGLRADPPTVQTKTLDHNPPMTDEDFDTYI
jgi:hypothetical protein